MMAPTDPSVYTVGWVSALTTEYVAAQAFLDEKHGRPSHVSPNDDNVYTLGRVGEHNVVIGVLPDGGYGITAAATVARSMLHSFPNIRIGLMVGIGGGVPSRDHDVRLGDIVVSAPRNGHGGVVQYDFGKTIQDQAFQTTGFLNQPPQLLRTAVADIKAEHEIDGPSIDDDIEKALRQKPRLREKYKKPDSATDRLFKSEVVHEEGANCAMECSKDSANLVPRARRADENNPAIHYGTIGSANQLMKDAIVRDQLAEDHNILCFEMEAAGLMNDFPCLVIRGICDYSDSHKNKEWQGYAAMGAAAYAKDLLSRIPPNKIENERKVSEVLTGVLETITKASAGVLAVKSHLEDKQQLEMLNWLTQIDYGPQQSDFYSRRQPGTGQWFLDSEEYLDWIAKTQILFCPGIPGAGKTILASIIINDLIQKCQKDKNVGISFIYCNFQRQVEQTVEAMIASLLKQLVEGLSSVPENVGHLTRMHQARRTRPHIEELLEVLYSVMSMFSRIYIVIDALDECGESDGTRSKFLSAIFKLHKAAANILVTSRPIPSINDMFHGGSSLEIRAHDDDLQRYLNDGFSRLPAFVRHNPRLWGEVKEGILETVDGMFLLAKLHFETLIGKTSPKAIRIWLQATTTDSSSYDNAYEEAMKRIQGQIEGHKVLAERVISWIVHAKRQLQVPEMQEALAVEPDSRSLDEENFSQIEDIISVCAGLVTVDKESNIIRLVHHTATEYFRRTRELWFPEAESDLASICITYITFDVFGDGACKDRNEIKLRLQSNHLYRYAAENWGDHARGCPAMERQILGFLQRPAHVDSACQILFTDKISGELIGFEYLYIMRWTPLHLSAYFGLEEAVEEFLDIQFNIDSKDQFNRTPLWLAASNSHESVVNVILEYDSRTKGNTKERVNVNVRDNMTGRSPIMLAAENGNEAIIKMLLDIPSVNIDYKDLIGRTPLSRAADKGHLNVVRLLLDTKKVNVNSIGNDLGRSDRTPLTWAAGNGHVEVAKLLLDFQGIDVDLGDGSFDQTPLSWAAKNEHSDMVKLLLESGRVDVNSKDNLGNTPLSTAVCNGSEKVVKLLLATPSVDLEVIDTLGRTPLMLAVEHRHESLFQMLLATGKMDINAADKYNRTALSWAAGNGNQVIVTSLLDLGVDNVDSKDTIYGRTPLSWAAENGHEAVVKTFLATGKVQVDSKDRYGCTPLWRAIENKHASVVRLLVDVGKADANSKDALGRTQLSWAAQNGNEGMIKMLQFAADIDIDSKDLDERTPLSWAALNGHTRVVEILVQNDANINSRDKAGRTPLSFAAWNGHKKVVRTLLAMDNIQLNWTDMIYGRSALAWAAENGHDGVVSALLDTRKVDVDSRDHIGRTPLSCASENGCDVVVQKLLRTNEVNVNVRDKWGLSPLMLAGRHNHESVVKALESTGKINSSPDDSKFGLVELP